MWETLLGAGAGALGGKLLGGNSKSALLGGLLGGAAGYGSNAGWFGGGSPDLSSSVDTSSMFNLGSGTPQSGMSVAAPTDFNLNSALNTGGNTGGGMGGATGLLDYLGKNKDTLKAGGSLIKGGTDIYSAINQKQQAKDLIDLEKQKTNQALQFARDADTRRNQTQSNATSAFNNFYYA